MRNVVRWIAASLALLGAVPAVAFVRETTTPGHPETGLCLWWRSRQVTYRVNATKATPTPCLNATTAEATVAAALSTWQSATRAGETVACTDFRFVEGPPTTITDLKNDGVNLVV